MSENRRIFRSLMQAYLDHIENAPDEFDEADDYLLVVDGRIVQVRLIAGGTMLASTMVFCNDGYEEQVLEEQVAEFNASQLLSGGYALLVEEESKSLYVEQALSIGAFDAFSLAAHLADFAERAITCSRWYLSELDQMQSAAPQRIAGMALSR